MILAIFDVSGKRVVEVSAISGARDVAENNNQTNMEELAKFFVELTGSERKFKSVAAIKQAIGRALTAKAFGAEEKAATAGNKTGAGPRKVNGPVATVRRICGQMKGRPRWEVIEACARAGVKRSTAATQYQHNKEVIPPIPQTH